MTHVLMAQTRHWSAIEMLWVRGSKIAIPSQMGSTCLAICHQPRNWCHGPVRLAHTSLYAIFIRSTLVMPNSNGFSMWPVSCSLSFPPVCGHFMSYRRSSDADKTTQSNKIWQTSTINILAQEQWENWFTHAQRTQCKQSASLPETVDNGFLSYALWVRVIIYDHLRWQCWCWCVHQLSMLTLHLRIPSWLQLAGFPLASKG